MFAPLQPPELMMMDAIRTPVVLAAAALLIAAPVGCDGADDQPDEPEAEATEAEMPVEAEQPGPTDDTEQPAGAAAPDHDEPAEPQQQVEPREAQPTIAEVDEEAADDADQLDPSLLDDELQQQIDEVPIPVMLPEDEQLLADVLFVPGDDFYAATMHVENDEGERDHMIVVEGSRMQADLPEGHKTLRDLEEGEYAIQRIHKIPTLSFHRFGVAYSVNVECNQPHKNEHCTRDDYITSLADSMNVAGGR